MLNLAKKYSTMALTDNIKNALRNFVGQNASLSFIFNTHGTVYDYSPYDRKDLASTYANNASVRMLINKVSEGSASLPIKVVDRDKNPLPDDWRNDFIKMPNDYQGQYDFIENGVREHLIFGEAFGLTDVRVGLREGELSKMVWLHSQFVEFERANGLGITKYVSGRDSTRKIDPESVIHLRGVIEDPEQSLHAISLLTTATREIEAINEGRNTEISGFKNQGARKLISAKSDRTLTETQGKNLKERLGSIGGGGSTGAGRVEFTGGAVEVHKLSETAVDLNVQESIKNNEKSLAKLLKVPLPLISEDSSTYNNMKSANRDFVVQSLIPSLEKVLQAINLFTNSTKDNAYLVVDTDNIEALKDDVDKTMTSLDKAFATYNQRQAALGLPGTDEAWGDLPIFPFNVAPVDPNDGFNEIDLNVD